ncbi:diguanylate cyclase [Marinibactrum halimedae]|uniref:diguanylate cyclase n=1 Tax=Marinibactrum halimedae TaxID=1444977 RepID=A0AA37T4A6_9GAMM|nr:diguanylate cyclase [Marinibactrum halimedae]MCD9457803.1 diguanylate cyclase [Marinibactrum halimedae]GLS24823.1 hypothetical protein GCM10007877_05370 [Marinibactrum halimedae]
MKILIVEDSATIRAGMINMISKLGHEPIIAHSGEEALQMIGLTDFDMVIMDVDMPGLDGFETTHLMREALNYRWLPIVFATGNEGDEKVLEGIRAGGDDYLTKPISPTLLEAKLIAMQRLVVIHNELGELNEKLSYLSTKDELTGLYNRRMFSQKAEEVVQLSKRFNKPVSVMMMDVDHFKLYNDFYGHVEGDQCLKMVGNCISKIFNRKTDLFARYGGEEFIVLLSDSNRYQALEVAEKLLNELETQGMPHAKSTTAAHVTVSIGIASLNQNEEVKLGELIERADKNLYVAKTSGRNRAIAERDSSQKTILIASADKQRREELTVHLQIFANIITAESLSERLDINENLQPDWVIYDKSCATLTQSSQEDGAGYELYVEDTAGELVESLALSKTCNLVKLTEAFKRLFS